MKDTTSTADHRDLARANARRRTVRQGVLAGALVSTLGLTVACGAVQSSIDTGASGATGTTSGTSGSSGTPSSWSSGGGVSSSSGSSHASSSGS